MRNSVIASTSINQALDCIFAIITHIVVTTVSGNFSVCLYICVKTPEIPKRKPAQRTRTVMNTDSICISA